MGLIFYDKSAEAASKTLLMQFDARVIPLDPNRKPSEQG
jgi:hypothetical protein